MYLVKKCDSYGYGRNDWRDVLITPDRENAISYIREEYRLLLAADPNLSSEDIDRYMNAYYTVPKSGEHIYGRRTVSHNGIGLAIMQTHSIKYNEYAGLKRPDRTEALDAILGAR